MEIPVNLRVAISQEGKEGKEARELEHRTYSPVGQTRRSRFSWLRSADDLPYPVLLPWLIVAMCDLAVKAHWLKYGGFAMAAAAMNHPFETARSYSQLERLVFFSGDLLFSCVIFPLSMLLVSRLFSIAWRTLLVLLISVASATIVLAQSSAFSIIGRFVSWDILQTGLNWWYENPDAGSDVLVRRFEVRVAAALLLIIALGAAGFVLMRRSSPLLNKIIARGFQGGAGVCLLLVVVTYPAASRIPVFANDTLAQTTLALIDDSSSALDRSVFRMTPQEQYVLYRRVANVPAKTQSSSYFGRAAGYNLLMFIFETTPTRVLNPATEPLDDFPNLRWLRDRSLVGAEHFSTFPATQQATFSIFSSTYMDNNIANSVSRPFPGLMQILDSAGYETGFYGYVWKSAGDDVMLQNLGFKKLVNSELTSTFFARLEDGNFSWGTGRPPLPIETRIRRDIGPLKALERDIPQWVAHSQRFAAVFFPQMGHGPWPPVPGNPNSSADERARFLARYQDAWLGELIDELERNGALDHSIIVVTADHGIRFRSENNAFPAGKIDEMSFQVPLLVFVPKLLDHEELIHWPTSHIDIQPTILDLLGMQQGRQWEQGSAIWDPLLSKRRTFLLGNRMFFADGYYDGGQYVMQQNQIGTVFESGTAHFNNNQALPSESAAAKQVRSTLRQFRSFEAAVGMELRSGLIH